jgi:hypothetical protein
MFLSASLRGLILLSLHPPTTHHCQFVVYAAMNWIRPSAQQSSPQQPQQPVAGSGAAAATSGRMVTVPHYNLWKDGQAFNLDVYGMLRRNAQICMRAESKTN